jgi:stage V sporulation protein B
MKLATLDSERPPHSNLFPKVGSAHRVLRNSTINLSSQGLYAVFHLLSVIILARGLGKDGFGEFYTLFALILVVQLVVEVGTGRILTLRISQAPPLWRKTAGEAGGVFALLSLASAAVFWLGGGLWSWYRHDAGLFFEFVAAGIACAALQVQRFAAGIFQAFEMFGYENGARILQGALFTAGVFALIGQGLPMVMQALAASQLLGAALMLVALRRRWGRLGGHLNLPILKTWLGEALPLGLGDMIRGLTWQLDTILLAFLQAPAVVGIYSIAYRPLGPLNWLPRAVLTAAFPSFARMAQDRLPLNRAFSTSIRLLWIISIPIAVAIFVCAEPLVIVLAGPDYLEAVVPLRILIWITSLSFLSFQFAFLLTAVHQQRSYAWLVGLVFVLEAAVELALIPWWSYLGACIGSILGEIAFTVLGLALCRRLGYGQMPWRPLALAVLAGAGMGLILWPLRAWPLGVLIPAVALATAFYLIICIGSGALQWQEVRRFFGMLTLTSPAADEYEASNLHSKNQGPGGLGDEPLGCETALPG